MPAETILCVATRDWNSLWRDSQQIMSRLAACYHVLYFDPGRDPEQSVLHELLHNSPNMFTLRTDQVRENLIVVPTPPSIPHARRFLPRSVLRITMPLIIRSNAAMIIRHIQWAMQSLNVKAPILWLYSPYQINLIGKFGEKLVCYFNYDEYASFVQNARVKDLIRRLDDELCSRVDLVFATSRSQWQHRKAINPNTYFAPNGVDFDLFNKALNPETPIPADLASLEKPIIGFVGWLGYQIDLDLLLGIAETYSDCSLVLVGPDDIPHNANHRRLRAMSNVHFLGRKALGSLPEYLKAMDVALIPYLLEGYTLTAYPLKLHEYLAAGRAIVATALPELRPYSHLVRIAETQAEFIRQIREALQDHGSQAIEARVAVARENTWDRRVADLHRILQTRLSGRDR
ncbi:MAG TPA: glycosyltransferase [Sedimentisphaerales bacterium]|nr:glycosyltransferase [Sedimentisphaerales bacterium]